MTRSKHMNNKVKCSNFNKGNGGGNDKPQFIFVEDEANYKYIYTSQVFKPQQAYWKGKR